MLWRYLKLPRAREMRLSCSNFFNRTRICFRTALYHPPIHISSKYGRQDFVRELLSKKPCFARELNKDGYSPMHLTAASGHELVVVELLKADHDLCLMKDRNGWTPLHWATYRARKVIINLLLSAHPKSASVLTHKGESFLHLAVKYNQCQDCCVLVQWLQQPNREDLINEPDGEGNTVLHLATSRRQYQTLQTLLTVDRSFRRKLQMNIKNAAGLTALDLFYQISGEPDEDIGQMLHGAGALRAKDPRASTNIQVCNRISVSAKCLELIYCSVEIPNVLLVLLVPVIIVALRAVSSPSDCSPPKHQDRNYSGDVRKYYTVFWKGRFTGILYNDSHHSGVHGIHQHHTFAGVVSTFTSANSLHINAMVRSLPHFIVISSYWFVWIGALTFSFTAFVSITLLIWLISKFPKKLFS